MKRWPYNDEREMPEWMFRLLVIVGILIVMAAGGVNW